MSNPRVTLALWVPGLLSGLFALSACGTSGDLGLAGGQTVGSQGGGGKHGTGGTAGGTTGGSTTPGHGGAGGAGGSAGGGSGGAGAGGSTTSGHGGAGGSTTSSHGGAGGSTTSSHGGGGGSGDGGHGGAGGCAKDPDCDDGLFCDGAETCAAGVCHPGTAPSCDDGVGCTTDACDEDAKACSHAPDDAVCDDKIACDGVETCDAKLDCQPGVAPSCDDGVACTDDVCDAQSGACLHVPSDLECDDGLYCDGIEHCEPGVGDPKTGCLAGVPIVCDDGVGCTVDACSEALQQCTHAPDDAVCGDGIFCDGQEVCVPGVGCAAGAPVVCDDGRTCTVDACSEAAKACTHVPNAAACSDGLYCDGVEACDPAGPAPSGCVAGAPVKCPSDGIACTTEACSEAKKACASTADNGLCPAGQFCVPAKGGCSQAKPCTLDAECNDGDDCNGVETCQGVCLPGKLVYCDDGIPCTVDSCNPIGGACSNTPNNAFCNNGLACDGVETCDPSKGCVLGKPLDCNDGVACTTDMCTEPVGTCIHASNDGVCDDGLFCNGSEICTVAGCKAGSPPVCNDGIACTKDVCDPLLNACRATADSSLCPCGQTCDAQKGGCGNFCIVATCQGKVYQCGDCADNDGDCKIDSADSQCLGPCDNSENSFSIDIPGANNAPCKSDCYFDGDTGSGNDDCYWSHKCDPLEKPADYPPEGSQCAYDSSAKIAGTSMTCSQAFVTQSAACQAYCGPLTPNGCDCFGCCAIAGAPTPVWLGSENPPGTLSCTVATLADPTKCKPCTQAKACLNTCEHCELCVGKPDLPADCDKVECPAGEQSCGLPGDPPCPIGFSCVTGCCPANPQ